MFRTAIARKCVNSIMGFVLAASALLVVLPLFSILLNLIVEGASNVSLTFFTKLPAPVGEQGGGMANAIVGSLVVIGLGAALGLPIGIGTGVYLSEFSNRGIASVIRFITDVMNGIPSIVFGLFAYELIVLPMKTFSALAGGFALGVMMIPVVTRTTEEVLRLVPMNLREAGLALGVSQWRTTVSIVMKTGLGGIITGVIVSLARVMGETAPLLFTALGNRFWSHSIFEPIAALPLQIFAYAISPFEDWHKQASAGALVLLVLVLVISIASRLAVRMTVLKKIKR